MSPARAIAFEQMNSPDYKEGILSHVTVCAKTQFLAQTECQ
ncbi:MAG TPA: hypothetical protein V6C50_11165 [Crinalium sp.]